MEPSGREPLAFPHPHARPLSHRVTHTHADTLASGSFAFDRSRFASVKSAGDSAISSLLPSMARADVSTLAASRQTHEKRDDSRGHTHTHTSGAHAHTHARAHSASETLGRLSFGHDFATSGAGAMPANTSGAPSSRAASASVEDVKALFAAILPSHTHTHTHTHTHAHTRKEEAAAGAAAPGSALAHIRSASSLASLVPFASTPSAGSSRSASTGTTASMNSSFSLPDAPPTTQPIFFCPASAEDAAQTDTVETARKAKESERATKMRLLRQQLHACDERIKVKSVWTPPDMDDLRATTGGAQGTNYAIFTPSAAPTPADGSASPNMRGSHSPNFGSAGSSPLAPPAAPLSTVVLSSSRSGGTASEALLRLHPDSRGLHAANELVLTGMPLFVRANQLQFTRAEIAMRHADTQVGAVVRVQVWVRRWLRRKRRERLKILESVEERNARLRRAVLQVQAMVRGFIIRRRMRIMRTMERKLDWQRQFVDVIDADALRLAMERRCAAAEAEREKQRLQSTGSAVEKPKIVLRLGNSAVQPAEPAAGSEVDSAAVQSPPPPPPRSAATEAWTDSSSVPVADRSSILLPDGNVVVAPPPPPGRPSSAKPLTPDVPNAPGSREHSEGARGRMSGQSPRTKRDTSASPASLRSYTGIRANRPQPLPSAQGRPADAPQPPELDAEAVRDPPGPATPDDTLLRTFNNVVRSAVRAATPAALEAVTGVVPDECPPGRGIDEPSPPDSGSATPLRASSPVRPPRRAPPPPPTASSARSPRARASRSPSPRPDRAIDALLEEPSYFALALKEAAASLAGSPAVTTNGATSAGNSPAQLGNEAPAGRRSASSTIPKGASRGSGSNTTGETWTIATTMDTVSGMVVPAAVPPAKPRLSAVGEARTDSAARAVPSADLDAARAATRLLHSKRSGSTPVRSPFSRTPVKAENAGVQSPPELGPPLVVLEQLAENLAITASQSPDGSLSHSGWGPPRKHAISSLDALLSCIEEEAAGVFLHADAAARSTDGLRGRSTAPRGAPLPASAHGSELSTPSKRRSDTASSAALAAQRDAGASWSIPRDVAMPATPSAAAVPGYADAHPVGTADDEDAPYARAISRSRSSSPVRVQEGPPRFVFDERSQRLMAAADVAGKTHAAASSPRRAQSGSSESRHDDASARNGAAASSAHTNGDLSSRDLPSAPPTSISSLLSASARTPQLHKDGQPTTVASGTAPETRSSGAAAVSSVSRAAPMPAPAEAREPAAESSGPTRLATLLLRPLSASMPHALDAIPEAEGSSADEDDNASERKSVLSSAAHTDILDILDGTSTLEDIARFAHL